MVSLNERQRTVCANGQASQWTAGCPCERESDQTHMASESGLRSPCKHLNTLLHNLDPTPVPQARFMKAVTCAIPSESLNVSQEKKMCNKAMDSLVKTLGPSA